MIKWILIGMCAALFVAWIGTRIGKFLRERDEQAEAAAKRFIEEKKKAYEAEYENRIHGRHRPPGSRRAGGTRVEGEERH